MDNKKALPSLHMAAGVLGVSRESLELLHAGSDRGWKVLTFPEFDGYGCIVGVSVRNRSGQKWMLKGSKRGLYLPVGWRDRGTDLFIVEGATDTAMLTTLGCSAIGRPSAFGGTGHIAMQLLAFPRDRRIIVVGENDQKPDGRWPGRDAAENVASQLQRQLNRDVHWMLPPGGAKDVRDWVQQETQR